MVQYLVSGNGFRWVAAGSFCELAHPKEYNLINVALGRKLWWKVASGFLLGADCC